MKKWTIEEAKNWLKEHNFKTGDMDTIANYYAFRQNDPEKYKTFAVEKKPFGFDEDSGVYVVYGIRTENGEKKSEIQSIKFYHGKKDEKLKMSEDSYFEIILEDKKANGRFLENPSKGIRANFNNEEGFKITSLEFPSEMSLEEAYDYIDSNKEYLSSISLRNFPIQELELFDKTIFRAGKWKGVEVKEDELDTIVSNFEKIREFGEDSIPIIKNHDNTDIDNKIGKITSIYKDGSEIKAKSFKLIDGVDKFINGIYEDISPFLIKNYSFESGKGSVTLPGWTLRDVSFVIHQADKKLNLTMKEESNLMDEKEKLELTEKVKTLEEELKKTREEQEKIQKEYDEAKQKIEMYENEKKQREVEDKLKMFEEQGKLLPAQHENNKQLLLSMSEEQIKMWEDGIKNLPEVVDFRTLGKKSGTESAKQIAEETLKRSGVIK